MAARKPKRGPPSLFALAERQIVGLYDAGVMSPAVLHQVVAAFAESGIDWNEKGALKTVDGRSVQEAVVIVMMPGRALRSAQKDFISVVEHLAGAQASVKSDVEEETEAESNEEDEDLLNQLGGNSSRSNSRAVKKRAPDEPKEAKRAAFNPLVGARALPGNAKR
ncbi:hypothetical protein [Caballeronia insecticola]|uniref:Uncharacterized protein n=1 Tax=Caballeronia insecticola TaxID=758793 RepID=R4WM78_9BURK|nr:hypothetical protein [Caballeronia insecticola]BAN25629.1 putative uncharacterized protein [Caballeronia insecticola]